MKGVRWVKLVGKDHLQKRSPTSRTLSESVSQENIREVEDIRAFFALSLSFSKEKIYALSLKLEGIAGMFALSLSDKRGSNALSREKKMICALCGISERSFEEKMPVCVLSISKEKIMV